MPQSEDDVLYGEFATQLGQDDPDYKQAQANRTYQQANPGYGAALTAGAPNFVLDPLRAASTQPKGAAPPAPAPAAPPSNAPAPPPTGQTPPAQAPNGNAGYYTNFGGGNKEQQDRQIGDATHAQAPAGFDAGKWADPAHTTDKYTAGRILAGGGDIGDVLNVLGPKGYTAIPGSTDKIKGPNGEIIDLWFDQEGAHKPQWTIVGGSSAGADPRLHDGIRGNAGGGNAGAGAGAGGAGSSAGAGTMYGGQDDAINAAIMRLLARGENPLSANDPTLQSQFLPTRNVMERGAQMARGSAAERMSAEGSMVAGGGGAFAGEANSINESLAGQEGQLMAGLVTSELSARRQDVANALQLAQGSQRMQLQQQLAALDRELERQRLQQENSRWYDDFAQHRYEFDTNASRPPAPV